MAVTRMHTNPAKPYEPDAELTNLQRQRFSKVANKAEERREQRELYKEAQHPQQVRANLLAQMKARRAKHQKQVVSQQVARRKRKTPELGFWRVLIWSIVLGAFWVWVQFMFP